MKHGMKGEENGGLQIDVPSKHRDRYLVHTQIEGGYESHYFDTLWEVGQFVEGFNNEY